MQPSSRLEHTVPANILSPEFEGFDIPLGKDDASRIDHLVNQYESRIVSHLDEESQRSITSGDRLSDRLAQFGGSWIFIIYFALALIAWILINLLAITAHWRFDPPPFILLNLCLSFLAAFQAPIILMSQNRQAARDKRESIIDFAINYKAQREVEDMQGDLHRIEQRLVQLEQMTRLLLEKIPSA